MEKNGLSTTTTTSAEIEKIDDKIYTTKQLHLVIVSAVQKRKRRMLFMSCSHLFLVNLQ